MRKVVWTDRGGWRRVSWVRDDDPDDMAPQGIPAGPPDLSKMDWEEVGKKINNALIDRDLLTWKDVQQQQNGVTNVITSVLRQEIILQYRLMED